MSAGAGDVFASVGLVVVAAGRGTRFGGYKQLAPLRGAPLLLHTLRAFDPLDFGARIVVLPGDLIESPEWRSIASQLEQPFTPVPGGAERADSVARGVAALPASIDVVAVHDGARPFPPLGAVRECVEALAHDPHLAGAIVASPVTDTIKRVGSDGRSIVATLPRQDLRRAETPQLARRRLLLDALNSPQSVIPTDEAMALESHGLPVLAITHPGLNPKVTTREDLQLAERLIEARESLEHNPTRS